MMGALGIAHQTTGGSMKNNTIIKCLYLTLQPVAWKLMYRQL